MPFVTSPPRRLSEEAPSPRRGGLNNNTYSNNNNLIGGAASQGLYVLRSDMGISFERPIPRPARTPRRTREIRVRNRRRAYIEHHPEYLESSEHEMAAPLLYDSLVRRFQTPAEREAEGKRKGYSGVLEADLLRGEARLAEVLEGGAAGAPSSLAEPSQSHDATAGGPSTSLPAESVASLDPDVLPPETKAEARGRWLEYLTTRFVGGGDIDFDYDIVDFNDEYDVLERKEAQDAWFDEEDPSWASEPDEEEEEYPRAVKTGETGIQDF